MSALRLGRSGVRFAHSYPVAHVSCSPAQFSLALRASQQPQLRAFIYATTRGYADKPAGRPKQHTGRAPARKTKTASKAPKAGKADTVKTAKTTKKGEAKPKTKTKTKTKAAAKSKPKPKPKTDEQIARKAARVQAEKIRDLKQRSLKTLTPPQKGRDTAWHVFHTEKLKELPKLNGIQEYGQAVKDMAEAFKSLTPNEREHYNHIANQNKSALTESWRTYFADTPPSKIKDANSARRQLTRLGVSGYATQIKDPRAVKQPLTSYTVFVTDRQASGDFKGVKPSEAMKLIAQEWRELPASEKQTYSETAARDGERYVKEYTEAFGEPPATVKQAKKAKD